MPLRGLFDESVYDLQPVESWWEASAPPPQTGFEPYSGEESCEVAIVGGGFTGLSCAYHLAKEHGIEARVLEAGHIGWGASGRNGGFVCFAPAKIGLKTMLQRYGVEETKRFYQSQLDAIDLVDQLGREEAIDYDRQGDGFFSVAHRPRAFAEECEYGEALTRLFGIPTEVYSKDRFDEIGHRGTEQFGAMLVKRK